MRSPSKLTQFAEKCENYLRSRTGKYEYRAIRYQAAYNAAIDMGLDCDTLLCDVGAGWTEFDYYLRNSGWNGRYYPVDGMLDGTDLEEWVPPRDVDIFVCLEILEHLSDPYRLFKHMQEKCNRGIILSVPNPRTTDVFEMDSTHLTAIDSSRLNLWGVRDIRETSFYGQENDSLFAVWKKAN